MKIIDLFEDNGKGYGSLTLSDTSIKDIHGILDELDITDYIDDLHITLIYDRSNPTHDITIEPTKQYAANVNSVKTLGEPNTKWYAITLVLDANDIIDRHGDYINAGFKHSYPEFIPHLSLKYKPSEEDIDLIKKNLNKFKDLNLVFSGECLKVIKE